MYLQSQKVSYPSTTCFFLLLIILLTSTQCQQAQQQIRQRIQNEQTANRENVGLVYGQNTQTLTFAMNAMSDFVVKSDSEMEVKVVIHIYWKQNNVYVSSEYREGENMRVLVYEDTYMILHDIKFYITTGLKFQAKANKTYTLRFLDQGRVSKLVAMQMTKSVKVPEKIAVAQQLQKSTNKLQQMSKQIKILSSVSQFSIVMSQKNIKNLQGSFDAYFWFLIVEAVVLLGIVGLQVKVLLGMLNNQSIV